MNCAGCSIQSHPSSLLYYLLTVTRLSYLITIYATPSIIAPRINITRHRAAYAYVRILRVLIGPVVQARTIFRKLTPPKPKKGFRLPKCNLTKKEEAVKCGGVAVRKTCVS